MPMSLLYWLMFNLVSTRTPRSFFHKLLSSWVAASTYLCLGLFMMCVAEYVSHVVDVTD